jgi:hypothetical protein
MLCIGYAKPVPDEGSLIERSDPSPVRDASHPSTLSRKGEGKKADSRN